MWSYQVPLGEAEPLEKHIVALRDKFKNKKRPLLSIVRPIQAQIQRDASYDKDPSKNHEGTGTGNRGSRFTRAGGQEHD